MITIKTVLDWRSLFAFVLLAPWSSALGQTVPPFFTDFESSDGYSLGGLSGQDGWVVSSGSVAVTNSISSSGSNSVSLTFSSANAQAHKAFAQIPGASVAFVDVFLKPSIDQDIASSTIAETPSSRVGFIDVAGSGEIRPYHGLGGNSGTWLGSVGSISIGTGGLADSWVRLTLREDYVSKTWDLYVNGILKRYGLGSRDLAQSHLSEFRLTSAGLTAGFLDDIYVGESNPLFTDADNDGMADAWELLYGLNDSSNDRHLDYDTDGLDNIAEYTLGTNPAVADSDADGIPDGLEIRLGSDPMVAGGSGLAPISGLVLHLAADTGVTVDGSGKVSNWLDQAQSLNATQANSGNRPSLVAGALNGKPVVRFNGSNNYLDLPHFLSGLSEAEVFVVLKGSSGSDCTLFSGFGAGGDTRYPNSGSTIQDGFGTTTVFEFGSNGASLTVPRVYNTAVSSAGWSARLDGQLIYTGRETVTFVNGGYTPVIGADHSGAWGSLASWFNGDLAEVLIYNHVLSSEERQAVGYYLKQKYDLSISSPAVPTNFQAVALSSSEISLHWAGGSGQDYELQRSTTGVTWETIATLNGNTSYSDRGLASGATYTYRLSAINFSGRSAYVGPSSATTFPGADIVDQFPDSGVRLWLRPEGLVHSSGKLGIWEDASGLAKHATQTANANRPLVVADAISGQPVVRFSGSNAYLNIPHFMTGASQGEAFFVLKGSNASGSAVLTLVGQSAGHMYYPSASNQISDGFGSNASYSFSAGGVNLTEPHIYNVNAAPNYWSASLDGTLLKQAESNSVNFSNGMFTPMLGAARNGAWYGHSNFFVGDIAEVVVFDYKLPILERFAVGSYLNRKFALGLPVAPVPSDLTSTAISPTKVALRWQSSAPGVFVLERSLGGAAWTPVAILEGHTSYIDTGLQAGSTYSYRIQGVSFGGASSFTAPVSATTLKAGEMAEIPTGGLKLWLRPEALVASASDIAQWSDSSGSGNNATQSNSSFRPVVVQNGLAGYAVVQFDGATDSMDLPNFLGSATAAEIFVMLKSSGSANTCLFSYFGTSGATFYPASLGQISDGFGTNTTYTFSPNGANLATPHLYSVSTHSGEWTAYMDGIPAKRSLSNTVTLSNSGFTPLIAAARGGAYYSRSNFFSGQIAEVMIYDRALTPVEREALTFYLNRKYQFSAHSFTSINSFNYDSDRDGLSNTDEAAAGTDPFRNDSDGDGMPDGWEIEHGLNPLSPDANGDPDGDGRSNLVEFLAGTNPQVHSADDPANSVDLNIFLPAQR